MNTPVIDVRQLYTQFEQTYIHQDLTLQVYPQEIFAIIGGSGSGKTTLLRTLLRLHTPVSGTVSIFGQDIFRASAAWVKQLQCRWGVLFQSGGLFSSLTVKENVAFPLTEHTALSSSLIEHIARLTIQLVGLPDGAADLYPAELSGGMVKRAALARAIVLNPELLFLDEPTAGLDPALTRALNELLLKLHDALGFTAVVITHEMDTLQAIADRVAFLAEGKVVECGTLSELQCSSHPAVRAYFHGSAQREVKK